MTKQLAQAIVTLTAAGQPVPAVLIEGLAQAILDQPLFRLAQLVQAGGDQRLEQTVELARLVLGADV